jgi:membrane-associated phospholipid phosphatase
VAVSRRAVAACCAAAYAALALLVAVGAFTWLDQWAVDQLMPGLEASKSSQPSLGRILTPFGQTREPLDLAADVWLYPASAPVSTLLVALCAAVLWRRGRRGAAVVWASAFVAANLAEVVTKGLLVRPRLTASDGGERVHVAGFDQALPSGHTLRAVLLAAALAFVWRRTGPAAVAWLATVPFVLVAAGWHVPTDVAAGLLLAAVTLALVSLRVAG